jgi:hypothetical protein
MKKGLLAGAAIIISISFVSKAIADGIPSVTPLTYSGVLQNSNGTPVTIQQSIGLKLFNDATAATGANLVCDTPAQNVTPDAAGRFEIVLAQACLAGVSQTPDVWVEVSVNGTHLSPRSKLNAIPYAVEAAHASRVIARAGSFGADGGVRTSLDGLYCGSSAATTGALSDGARSGLRAGKSLCETACASPTAHMCTTSETVRSYELGMEVPDGWTKGLNAAAYGPVGTYLLNDCSDWTVGVTTTLSTYTNEGGSWAGGHMTLAGCGTSQAILCCD